eukprot:1160852-Pelagomonas_calceolata.AAC.4
MGMMALWHVCLFIGTDMYPPDITPRARAHFSYPVNLFKHVQYTWFPSACAQSSSPPPCTFPTWASTPAAGQRTGSSSSLPAAPPAVAVPALYPGWDSGVPWDCQHLEGECVMWAPPSLPPPLLLRQQG